MDSRFHRSSFWTGLLAVVVSWLSGPPLATAACPFCPPSSPPLSEQLAGSDAAVLVKWQRTTTTEGDNPESSTEFAVIEVLRPYDNRPKVGDRIVVPYLLQSKPGNLFFLMGQQTEGLMDWLLPIEVTEISYAYIKQAPNPEQPARDRLPYFLKFLQFSDPLIANDAFAEFSRAQYADVAQLRDRLSRATLRKWITELPPTEQMRAGFYGMLLGLCGNTSDGEFLANEVLPATPPDQFRLGLDGMMAGYVLLTGEVGLQRLVQAKLDRPNQPDGDLYAFINALRFLGEFGAERVPQSQVSAAMARFLSRPAFAELALVDLARWQHWAVLPEVLRQIGKPPFDEPAAKRQLIQFAMACVKAADREPETSTPSATQAREFLTDLQQADPAAFRDAQRYFRGLSRPGTSVNEATENARE